jgi:hypothetical protein
MKKVFLTFLVCLVLQAHSIYNPVMNDYCTGWDKGYKAGYCYEKGFGCIAPISPICPIPRIDCMEGYKCGYNRGFVKGLQDSKPR